MRPITNTLKNAASVLKHEGPRFFWKRVELHIKARFAGKKLILPVKMEDALAVDWTEPGPQLSDPITVTDRKSHIAWVMSPPSATSGGHQNLFRFIDYAERAGHTCSVYIYNSLGVIVKEADLKQLLRDSPAYPDVKARVHNLDERGVAADVDAIFATGWETAYPVFRDPSRARRFYFVQDFEPAFYPAGSEAILAENTYRFAFHGITAGGWLSKKLRDEYGMPTDHFDFSVDRTHYSLINRQPRKEIFFYARPVTPRRAFELGVIALAEFAKQRPEYTINMAGWDVSDWDIPFPYQNLSGLSISELNPIYNRCAAGLVLSLSNMSLLPLELIASGVAPVVNDAPNNRLVSDNPYIEYVQPAPGAIAKRLVEVVSREDALERSIAMSESLEHTSWDDSGRQFVEAFERAMRG
ncbi:rhamnosyltransferase WsaF family glycosyltransferase [Plantibacter sp. CFBP 13570]|uniref:rhamnosyltransferase WsaF family glycosyltransferase n=1 Tax=Plantibacter sp. CFBP 13570 TaxID=2775272 RepID=UPI001930CB86|nr:glycosyltransferase family 1 protein [Plantibacter sp. CFBP 13570]MBD8533857.1 glycosyltransferase family 1 protein [Plantibacter sp. CFBP 13570]